MSQRTTLTPEPAYPIASVDSALRLILMIADHGQVRIMDVSEQLGVARSTAHRLLQMLQHHGFVHQDPRTKSYEVGTALLHIGLQAVRDLDIRAVARPHMERLRDDIRETVHLHVFRGTEVVCLESLESPEMLRVGSRLGLTLPSHSSAAGQAILADLGPGELRAFFPSARLPEAFGSAVVTRKQLEVLLAGVREACFALQHEQTAAEVSALAVPIRDSAGRTRFSLSVAAPSRRLTDARVEVIAPAAQTSALRIASALD